MKTPRFVALSTFVLLCPMSTILAQNLDCSGYFAEIKSMDVVNLDAAEGRCFDAPSLPLDRFEVPGVTPALPMLPQGKLVMIEQDNLMSADRVSGSSDVEAVDESSVLSKPSLLQKIARMRGMAGMEISVKELQIGLSLLSAVYRPVGEKVDEADCSAVLLAVGQRIRLDRSKVLEIVEAEMLANSGCACEIVKAAIMTSEADVPLVGLIVETAMTAAPETMRIVSQCAIAAMPEALAQVQAVLAKLDPNGSVVAYSSKGAKSPIDQVASEQSSTPLDIPKPFDPVTPSPITTATNN